MLRIRTADTGRVLRSQRDVSTTFIGEVVHLLRHNVSGIAQALEHPKFLEHGGHNAFKPSSLHDRREDSGELAPATRLRRQDVAGTRGGLE